MRASVHPSLTELQDEGEWVEFGEVLDRVRGEFGKNLGTVCGECGENVGRV